MQTKDSVIGKDCFVRGLALETVLIYGGVLAVLRILVAHVYGLHWLAVPAVLLVATLAPCFFAKRSLPAIGLDPKQLAPASMLVGIACLTAFPLAYLASRGLPIPLRPNMPGQEMALEWLFCQFFYVAVSEEVFFRGYLQRNVQHILSKALPHQGENQIVSILVSSCAFGLAHYVVFAHAGALLTVFPGLVLGWLYSRTNTLFAPILFHGLANVFYSFLWAVPLPG
jgi:membrane protease YdiL (CAAX protease family)